VNPRTEHHLFDVVGIELEYMLVDAATLDVLPVCDRLLKAQAGRPVADVAFDDVSWSNELALHVVEIKTATPATTLVGLAEAFGDHLRRINAHLARIGGPGGARLMPTAMHPWMDPHTQTRLWTKQDAAIYSQFNRIFDCRGHGWSNLQSVHINLPFADDAEFGRLHAAIRLLLPLLPALAASSPIAEARPTGLMDTRLHNYRGNCARVPSVTGRVIPEPVFTIADYHRLILERMYADIAPLDADGILQEEWLNARGAIARFERNTIEIRVLDVQETPAADLAIAALVVATLKLLVEEALCPLAAQQAMGTDGLVTVLDATIRDGDAAMIGDATYLATLGMEAGGAWTAGQVWRSLAEQVRRRRPGELDAFEPALAVILEQGPLARRILAAVDGQLSRERLVDVYGRLCDCLSQGRMFAGADAAVRSTT
jgi:gamma-glutamyl:cysteine ligase YbdK (ATP-grasp superfamily)